MKGSVVDIGAALGDRSAAITFGAGVTPGPPSGNEILQIPWLFCMENAGH